MAPKVINFPKQKIEAPESDSDPELEKQIERIQRRYANLRRKIHNNMESPAAISYTLKYLLQSSLDMVPLAEEDYRRSRKGMYAFISLGNQIRELMVDMRQSSSSTDMAAYIIEEIFVPALQSVLQHVLNDFTKIKKSVVKSMPAPRGRKTEASFNAVIKNYGSLLEEIAQQVRDDTTKYISGK